VVVQLHDSDDSESEPEASSSTMSSFGCLDLMIKEARRTVEVGGVVHHQFIPMWRITV
jgi:hypothetical protein